MPNRAASDPQACGFYGLTPTRTAELRRLGTESIERLTMQEFSYWWDFHHPEWQGDTPDELAQKRVLRAAFTAAQETLQAARDALWQVAGKRIAPAPPKPKRLSAKAPTPAPVAPLDAAAPRKRGRPPKAAAAPPAPKRGRPPKPKA